MISKDDVQVLYKGEKINDFDLVIKVQPSVIEYDNAGVEVGEYYHFIICPQFRVINEKD